MCLLLSDPRLGQIVDDGLGFYLEVAGELIDADLIWFRHSSVGFSSSSALFESTGSACGETPASAGDASRLSG
jgi:hypothetical protein